MARMLHGYHDTALIRSELDAAGFSNVVIETKAEQSRASSPTILPLPTARGRSFETKSRPGPLENCNL